MTGVDKLHEQGILGKGVKVGIVDTGTEYTHPAVGFTRRGCFYMMTNETLDSSVDASEPAARSLPDMTLLVTTVSSGLTKLEIFKAWLTCAGYWPYPGEERQPDEDPMDQAGHGTHVAGIVAGKSDE